MTQVKLRTPARVRIVFDGQSHNFWPVPQVSSDGLGAYPSRLMATHLEIPWCSVAVGDTGWTGLSATAATRLYPHARNAAGCYDVLIMSGGLADIYADHVDGATTYARAVAYAAAARSAGFHRIIATTMPPWGPGSAIYEDPQAITDHNTLMMADAGNDWDGVAAWHLDPALDDATDSAFFEADKVHFKAPAAAAAALVVAPVLTAVLDALP